MFYNTHKNNIEDSITFSDNDIFKDNNKSVSQDIYLYTYNDNNLIFNRSCQSAIYKPSNLKFKKFNSFMKNTKKLNFKEKLIRKINYIQKNQQNTNNKLSSLISILFNALLIKNNYSIFHFDFMLKNNIKSKIINDDENVAIEKINNKDINNIFRLDYNLNKANKQNNNSKTTINKVQRYYKPNDNNKNDIFNNQKKTNTINNNIKNNTFNNKNDNQIHITNSHTTNNLIEDNDIRVLTEEMQNSLREKERILLENVKEINTKLSGKGPVKVTLKPIEKSINLNNTKNINENNNINSVNSSNNSFRNNNMYKNNIKNISKDENENNIETDKEIKDNNKNINESENIFELFKSSKTDQNKYDNSSKQNYPRKIRGFNFRNNINNSSIKRPNSTKPSDDVNEDKREMNELNNINFNSSNAYRKNITTVYDFNKKSNELENEFEDELNINKYFYMSNRK